MKAYSVCNVAQIDILPAMCRPIIDRPAPQEGTTIERAELFVADTGADIQHGR